MPRITIIVIYIHVKILRDLTLVTNVKIRYLAKYVDNPSQIVDISKYENFPD
ncbi:MAG: hypothetical protein PWR13_815 [Archaeoglobi archaeon]|nr:hypothetical protein [Archaeoglobi archaeon]MDK2781787.1 hypothetical protein [Archaeoglobi archaeon]